MPASLQLDLDLAQLRPHALRLRVAPEQKLASTGLATNVGEPEEAEGLSASCTSLDATLVGTCAEHEQTRLVRTQLQPELAQSLAKLVMETHGGSVSPESSNSVVSISHHDHLTVSVSLSPLSDPQVVDIVQVDVRQQARDRRALRRSLVAFCPLPVFEDPSAKRAPTRIADSLPLSTISSTDVLMLVHHFLECESAVIDNEALQVSLSGLRRIRSKIGSSGASWTMNENLGPRRQILAPLCVVVGVAVAAKPSKYFAS